MIKLHFGSELSQFFKSILHQFRHSAQAAWEQTLAPPTLIAGTPLIQRWLSQKMAEQNGIVVGLQVQRLEAALWRILQKPPEYQLLNVDALEPILLQLIADKVSPDKTQDPQWEDLQAYLCPQGELEIEKWVQLAKKWARSYLEYELNRPSAGRDPGLLATWAKNQSYFNFEADNPSARVEQTQKALWFELDQILKRDYPHYQSLPQLWEHNRKLGFPELPQIQKHGPWMIVGLPGLSHFHRNALFELGQNLDMDVYLLNPCAEFWEDLQTRRKTRKLVGVPKLQEPDYQASALDELYPQMEADQKLLQLWGGADKENLLLWGQLSEDLEFESRPEIHGQGVLQQVQNLILNRESTAQRRVPRPQVQEDSSLVILEAPSQIREMESIRDLALGMLDPSHPLYQPGLKTSDCCVLIPDLPAYQVALEQSFLQGSSLNRLPVFIWQGQGKSSQVGAFLMQWMELLQSEFPRGKVFKFLQNPLVLSKLRMDRSLLSEWEDWAEQLHLYRGFDSHHRKELGDHEPIDIHTWQYAFDRIIAGWMGLIPLELGSQTIYPWKGSVLDNKDNTARMIDEISRLYHSLQNLSHSLAQGVFDKSLVIEEVSQWLDLERLDYKEEQIWSMWLRSLDGLERCTPMNMDLFCTWSRNHLEEELEMDLLKYTGSMLIAPLKMGHVLPYKVIFLAGMGPEFPGQLQKNSMDLLKHKRILGDMDPVKNSQAAFLHCLLSAQDRLILSYTASNIQKDEILYPSSVLTELDRFVIEALWNDGEKEGLPRIKAKLLSRDPEHLQPQSLSYSYDKSLLEAMSKPLSEVKAHSGPWRSGGVQLRDLASFLKSPLDHRLRRGLGLYDQEESDSTLIEDEPLGWEAKAKGSHFKELALELFQACQKQGSTLQALAESKAQEVLEFQINRLKREGKMAESYFAQSQIKALQSFGQTLLDHLKSLAQMYPQAQWLGAEDPFWTQFYPAQMCVELDPQTPQILSSSIPEFALWAQEQNQVILLSVTGSDHKYDKIVDIWLSSLWLRSHWEGKIDYVQIGKGTQLQNYSLNLDSKAARAHLEFLLHEERSFERSPSHQHMPMAPCIKLLNKNLSRVLLQEALEDEHSGYYPSSYLQLVEPRIPDHVQTLLSQRFQGFADLVFNPQEAAHEA